MKRTRRPPLISEEQYKKFFPMLINRASSYSKTTNLPVEDLLSLNNEIFCEATLEWNPSKGSFSSWLWTKLDLRKRYNFRLIHRSSEWRYLRLDINTTEIEGGIPQEMLNHPNNCPFRTACFHETIDKLSADAKTVTHIILNPPPKHLFPVSGKDPQRKIIGALSSYLRRESKWSEKRIQKAFREIRIALSE